MISSSFEDFLYENSLENRVVLEVGYVLLWTNAYPTFDLWCTCHFNLTHNKVVQQDFTPDIEAIIPVVKSPCVITALGSWSHNIGSLCGQFSSRGKFPRDLTTFVTVFISSFWRWAWGTPAWGVWTRWPSSRAAFPSSDSWPRWGYRRRWDRTPPGDLEVNSIGKIYWITEETLKLKLDIPHNKKMFKTEYRVAHLAVDNFCWHDNETCTWLIHTEPHYKASPRLCDCPSGCGGELTQPRNNVLV